MTRNLQQMIHIGCRQLGLTVEDRRALQLQVCNKSSIKDMNAADLTRLLDRLKQDGFKPQSTGSSKGRKARKLAPRKDLRLVHLLWSKLGEVGALDRPGRDGLNAFIRSRFGDAWGSVPADVDMLRDHRQIEAVIAALKAMGRKHQIDFDFNRGRS